MHYAKTQVRLAKTGAGGKLSKFRQRLQISPCRELTTPLSGHFRARVIGTTWHGSCFSSHTDSLPIAAVPFVE